MIRFYRCVYHTVKQNFGKSENALKRLHFVGLILCG